MSFQVVIQRNESETIRIDKTLVTIATLTGNLKEETSIIDPTILVDANLVTLKSANYLTVEAFGRSYFINDITSYRNNLVEISCHVDVLSSFKTQIRANKGIVFRQENNWNLYLNDGVLEVYQNPIVTTHEFPNGFDSESYVLALAGRPAEANVIYDADFPGGVIIGSGGGSDTIKTCAGLAEYATAQLGLPYWFGTFGQTGNSALLDNRRAAYPSYYTKPSYAADFGKRVHDCVGLIKGYHWSDTPTSTPVYVKEEDDDVIGLWGRCVQFRGKISDFDSDWVNRFSTIPGVCVFVEGFSHVGVSMGDGSIIEARGSDYGVVRSYFTDVPDRDWMYWGVPSWMMVEPSIPVQ